MVEFFISFMKIRQLDFMLGLTVDNISLIAGAVVTLITFCTMLYSVFYMKPSIRYYGLMSLFYLGVMAFIFSPNLFQMFVFWEVISAISYLLISYEYSQESVSVDSKRAFLINIIGDITFFSAFILLSDIVCHLTNNYNMASIAFSDYSKILPLFMSYVDSNIFNIICLLFVISAMIKSAQFPINSWIINAMSAPTPVSALIHSSTLVMMGAYLLIRLYPMLIYSTLAMSVILIAGFLTTILTSLSALVQTNIKKTLAYSTSSQLGLVFIAIGLYKPLVAFIYLIIHAFIKSLLFFASGVVIKSTGTKNIFFMGGLRKNFLLTAIAFLIGAIALSGIGFCGFSIKSMMVNLICSNNLSTAIFAVLGVLTTLYIFRLYFLVFENKNVAEVEDLKYLNWANFVLSVMLVFVILLTYFLPHARICPLYVVNAVTVGLAYLFYNTRFKLPKIPILYPLVLNGFYVNKIYYWGEEYLYKFLSMLVLFIDKYIFGGFELILNRLYKFVSSLEYKLQTNNFQSYISYGVWCMVGLIIGFTLIYLFTLNYFGV